MLRQTLAQRGLKGLYAGCSAVVVGNAVKAGVRFTTYDQFKQMLSDDEVLSFLDGIEKELMGRADYPHQDRCWQV